ncbi:cbb3-type cytochrome c oxidase subunit I [Halospeciosus flavus]|uniref:Cbb3-type cytochrome c oxidase subunit I n=1 Tax=Halospeciosus flavus TaxID=3032283 RepID=A0ABD5Z4M3_9EURY|nr:cbb3-type cytochrome c oxidase subunit I [Halospeciosus flavus]
MDDVDRLDPLWPLRWVLTTDHERLGLLYLVVGTGTGLWGAVDAMMLRTALLTPKANIYGEMTYNALFTAHGLTMLFLFAVPVVFGLGSYLLPTLVGADEVALPRVNAACLWLLPPAIVVVRIGLLTDLVGYHVIEPPMTGWTFYPPLSLEKQNAGVTIVLAGIFVASAGFVANAANFLTTVVSERTVPWHRLDIFSWTMLVTSGMVLFAFPMLMAAALMLVLDRVAGTPFFVGDPLGFQHMFWFFGHPVVYILVLPPMGILSLVIPRFSGRRLFGYEGAVYSTLAIGVLSFGLWAHHMFTTGLDPRIQSSFMAVTLAIAVPSSVKVLDWLATMWNGRIRLDAPMLFAVGAIANFVVGGVTGVFVAAVPVDDFLHGTIYVVGHFHFLFVGTIVFALFSASYYWYPLFTGRTYNHTLAAIHFWLSMAGVVFAFGAMLVMGMDGLPRRMAAYPPAFAGAQQFATVAAFVLGVGQLVWLWNVVRSLWHGESVGADPWDLGDSGLRTPEWEE